MTRYDMRRPDGRAGFSLVETMVMMVIATVALVATAGAATTGARLARATTETRAAARACESLMERVRATPYGDVAATFDGTTVDLGAAWGADSSVVSSVSVAAVATGDPKWGVLKVTVRTRWKGCTGDSSAVFVTYVCDRAAGTSLASIPTMPADGAY
jgi:Tfp pilus assembly protein PilV